MEIFLKSLRKSIDGDEGPEKPMEKSSVPAIFLSEEVKFLVKCFVSLIFSVCFNPSPVFSIACLCILYAPHLFLSVALSPVLVSTAFAGAALLRFRSSPMQQNKIAPGEIDEAHRESPGTESGFFLREREEISRSETQDVRSWIGAKTEADIGGNVGFAETLRAWNRDSRLEVIDEEREGEDGEDPQEASRRLGLDGLIATHFDFSDSDSQSSEGESPPWNSQNNLCFWEEMDLEMDELIEIPLGLKATAGVELEEENLIEIDIFSAGK